MENCRSPSASGTQRDFANHEFFDEAKTKTESSWLGQNRQAQVQMWDTLLAGMFEQVVPMVGRPGPGR